MQREIDIHKTAGILIQDRKFLVTRPKGKSYFISPGGKVELGETTYEALKRELREEIEIDIDTSDLQEFGTFYAPAQGQKNKYLQMDVFLVTKWKGEIKPANEIEETMWIDSKLPPDIEVGSIFQHDVLPRLKSLDLID